MAIKKLWPAALLVVFPVLVLAACGDDPAGPEPIDPEFITAVVVANPANAISAEVKVQALGYESVQIRVWRDGEVAQMTPPVPFNGDTTIAAAVLGLHPVSDYSFEVVLNVGSVQDAVDTQAFTTGALPDWLPSPTGSGASPSPGFVTLSLAAGPAIADNTGRIVWYLASPDTVLTNFQAHADGTYTVFGRGDEGPYRVYDELGRRIDRLGCVGWESTRFHEVRVMAGGDYWVLCDETTIEDLTQHGGGAAVEFDWTVLQHVAEDRELLWEWKTSDHFEITDHGTDGFPTAERVNMTHGNAIAFDTDGNILLSFRNLNEVTKIDAQTGDVIWRFGGGFQNEFTFVGDPKGRIEGQHGLRVVEPGVIQLMDNGDQPPSRLVRYRMDEQAMTATLVLEYIHASSVYSRVGGGTDVMPSGGGLVSFGRGGVVAEVSEAGEQVWELLNLDGLYVFRTQRLPSLYASERRK
jgi:outer membrane protein assembly factor BamB